MSAHMTTSGSAIIFCNAGSCEASHTSGDAGVETTRAAAGDAGWSVGVGERRDFCPKHAGVAK